MHHARLPTFLAVLLVLLASCSPGAGVMTTTLSDGTIDLVRGGTVSVAVTVSASGPGPAVLSISGLPAHVTASFDPPALDGGATSSVLTLTATAAAAEGAASIVITAVRGDRAATAEATLTVTSLTVTGTVLGVLGDPRSGTNVAIAGVTATTGSDGTFTIGGVAVPYDLTVYSALANGYGHVFVGLTTATPTVLPLYEYDTAIYRTATIAGALPGPVPAGRIVRVCVEGLAARVVGCTTVPAAASAYSFTASWPGGATEDVRVHALLIVATGGEDVPTGYEGYATTTGSVSDGATATIDVAAYGTAPGTTSLSGVVSVPAGYQVQTYGAATALSAMASMPAMVTCCSFGTSFTLPVPLLGNETFDLVASAAAADDSVTVAWRGGLAAGSAASMTLPSPAVPISPPNGTTSVTTSTVFSVSGDSKAIKTFIFEPTVPGPTFAVTTMDASARVPDLSSIGLSVPAASVYDWYVYESGTATSPNDGAFGWIGDYYSVYLSVVLGGAPSGTVGTITRSAPRTFTTN